MLQQFYPVKKHNYHFELNKDMNFSAAHFIPNEKAGNCRNPHGHTYFVNVTIVGNELDDCGFLVNFQTLKELVHDRYDHTVLNDFDEFSHVNSERFPTTEVVARHIYKTINKHLKQEGRTAKCLQVLVRETPTSYVTYSEEH